MKPGIVMAALSSWSGARWLAGWLTSCHTSVTWRGGKVWDAIPVLRAWLPFVFGEFGETGGIHRGMVAASPAQFHTGPVTYLTTSERRWTGHDANPVLLFTLWSKSDEVAQQVCIRDVNAVENEPLAGWRERKEGYRE